MKDHKKEFALMLALLLGALTFDSCAVVGHTNEEEYSPPTNSPPTYSPPTLLLPNGRADSLWCDVDCDGIDEWVPYEKCEDIDCDDDC